MSISTYIPEYFRHFSKYMYIDVSWVLMEKKIINYQNINSYSKFSHRYDSLTELKINMV